MTHMVLPDMDNHMDYSDIPIENYKNLAGAIVASAGSDYRNACENLVGLYSMIKGARNRSRKLAKKISTNLAELYYCQRFFRSGSYAIMCDIDGEYVIDAVIKDTGLTEDMINTCRDYYLRNADGLEIEEEADDE